MPPYEPSSRLIRSRHPQPFLPVEAAPVVAVAVTPADDSSAAMDAREENVPPAAGLMSLFKAVGNLAISSLLILIRIQLQQRRFAHVWVPWAMETLWPRAWADG